MAEQQQLDTAATARGPQAKDPQEEYFTVMVAGLRSHIFGKGEGGIAKAVQEADDVGRVIGELTYAMVSDAAHQLEAKGVRDLDYDMIIGVATEVIDDISELMEALGMPINQKDREYALLYAQQLYVEQQQPSDDMRRAASQDMARLKQDGEVDQAVTYVQKAGMEAGADPFGVNEMPSGEGKSAGLMGA